MVGCAITLSRLLLGTSIPDDVSIRVWPDGTSEEDIALFIERRILASNKKVATGFPPKSNYNAFSLVRSIVERLVPGRSYMVNKYGDSARGILGLRFYAIRMLEVLRIAGAGVKRPQNMRDDFAVDQWMHSLLNKS